MALWLMMTLLLVTSATVHAADLLCMEARNEWEADQARFVRGVEKLHACVENGDVHDDCYYELSRVTGTYDGLEASRAEAESMCSDAELQKKPGEKSQNSMNRSRPEDTHENTNDPATAFGQADVDPETIYGDTPIDFSDLQQTPLAP